MDIHIGDSVVVKKGTKDPDFDFNIEGWQGRVYEIPDKNIVSIEWDSITLQKMPPTVIEECENMGYEWNVMSLEKSEVTPTSSRDTQKETEEIYNKLQDKYEWVHLGEEGKRIQSILSKASSCDLFDSCEAWENYFNDNLHFPLTAIVAEAEDRDRIRIGSKVVVKGISEAVEFYGIIVNVQYKNTTYSIPLANLEVLDNKSSNYQPIKDHAIWFANM